MAEETIAALDGDWSEFSEKERAAFAVARKLTYEPHRFGPADFAELRKHFTELQCLEILFTISNNNATTRWTEALGIPQEEHRDYLTPAALKYRDRPSLVAPLQEVKAGAVCKPAVIAPRPPLESRAEVEAVLERCRQRKPNLSLVDETEARAMLPKDWKSPTVPNWVRLFAHFPRAGGARVNTVHLAAHQGNLEARLRAQLDWICARHDRAWYAVGQARQRLLDLGETADAIYALDGDGESFSPRERMTFAFVRKLTAAPASIVDDDIAQLRKHYTDAQVAELVYRVASAAFFNRVTEACGLPLE